MGVTITVESFVVAASIVLELVGGHFELGTNVSENTNVLKGRVSNNAKASFMKQLCYCIIENEISLFRSSSYLLKTVNVQITIFL